MRWDYFRATTFYRYQKLIIVIGLTFLAYYAAISRAQALPWLLASIFTSTLITGYLWPRWLIKNLSVTRQGSERGEEGEVIVFDVEISNDGVIPRFMIQAVDYLPFVGAATGEINSNHQILGLIAYIGGGKTHKFSLTLLCEKRGSYKLGPVGLVSSFPLGLLEAKQNKNGGTQALIIYPDIFPIISLPLMGTPSEIHRGGFLLPKGAGSAEFSGLREYHRGDNPRHIHWPTTARANEIMVKEFEPVASASLHIIMDLSEISNVGLGKHSSFEYSVRIAASIGRYATNKNMPIRLSPNENFEYSIGLSSGESHFKDILDCLAIIDAKSSIAYSSVLEQVAKTIRYGQTAVIFLSEPEDRILSTIESIALLQARGANILAIHFERGTFNDTSTPIKSPWTKLFDLGISYISVKKGDDLSYFFNS